MAEVRLVRHGGLSATAVPDVRELVRGSTCQESAIVAQSQITVCPNIRTLFSIPLVFF
jgi:hypothetical protein